jgi:Zn-dependent peptidase ImmA (M78 family)
MHRELPTGSVETESAADQFASAFLLPKTAFAREFRTKRFSWEHVFELKRHWQVSAAAIVRRARDLDLIDEIAYRRAFQHMSFKKWRTEGEPYEPSFQEPELFVNAINALGREVQKRVSDLCADLYLSPKIFAEITGISMDNGDESRADLSHSSQSKVLQFRLRPTVEPS